MRLPLPRTRRGRWTTLALVLVVLGGAWAWWYFDSRWPWYHFRTIIPGALYRAGQPDADDVATAAERYGVKTIVNLRAERGPFLETERAAAERLGLRWVDVPVPMGKPPSLEQVEQLLGIYDDPARRPLLFHCEYGSVRSAAVEALFRVEALGETAEQALERTRTFSQNLEKKYPEIPAFVRSYVPRRERPGAASPR
jgi:protein tyrosine phosphatase (PTP) superfamily phosphohydrolase (DUF442 family)